MRVGRSLNDELIPTIHFSVFPVSYNGPICLVFDLCAISAPRKQTDIADIVLKHWLHTVVADRNFQNDRDMTSTKRHMIFNRNMESVDRPRGKHTELDSASARRPSSKRSITSLYKFILYKIK